MNTKSALAALRIIDAKVDQSTHEKLGKEDLRVLADASVELVRGVKGDSYAQEAAEKIHAETEAGFMWLTSNPLNYSVGILEQGRLLANYLRRQPESY
ncbi:hypothetical protein [Prosthecobacter sp.]|uniref:hypothetical protein n=1 Tax=Prosthecobacter sp. TaxID=1965333 RepID=UPI0037833B6F